jgi:hypothetical protein
MAEVPYIGIQFIRIQKNERYLTWPADSYPFGYDKLSVTCPSGIQHFPLAELSQSLVNQWRNSARSGIPMTRQQQTEVQKLILENFPSGPNILALFSEDIVK